MKFTPQMQEIADKVAAEGVSATCDPRAATPPCVLVEGPNLRYDVGCGATGEWAVVALAPNPANLDAYIALEPLMTAVEAVLPLERWDKTQYLISPDNPPLPAYRATFTQGVDF